MVDTRNLEYFVAVAETLHFGRAAERLFVAQPTVSEAVRRLERDLGGQVFERTSRSVQLTELGTQFLPEARAALAAVELAFHRGRNLAIKAAPELTVGHTSDLSGRISGLILRIRERVPNVVTNLVLMPTASQIRDAHERRLHAAICWAPPCDEELVTQVLETRALAVIVRQDHRLAHVDHVTYADIASEPLIAMPRNLNERLYDGFAAAMNSTGRPWNMIGSTAGTDNVAGRVLSGLGVAIVLDAPESYQGIEGIAYRPIADDTARFDRALVWSVHETSPALPSVVSAIRGFFQFPAEHAPGADRK